jgi:MinD-like ATPase involved in chromosome partitioning or flagellar assembly
MRDGVLGGRWYIIGVLNAREALESQGAVEEGVPQVESGLPPADEQAPSILQQRARILEMASVFSELSDGALRALARRMRAVPLAAGETLRLGARGGDLVIFLASGACEGAILDAAGKVVLTRRPKPGDLLILPAPRSGDRFVTSIHGTAAAILLTLDRDGLLEALGPEVEHVSIGLDKLWEQELAAADAAQAQEGWRAAAPIAAFFSAKGGSGTTTLAINTAAVLGGKYPRQVLLLDLSEPFGHAALFADLIATGSIASASKAPQADFTKNLRGAIANHRSGIGVLPATLRPEEVDLLTAELTTRALDIVAPGQRVIVADLGTSLAEAALVVIERAQCVVIVVPPEIAAMTDARRALTVFRDIMGLPDSRIEIVLNQRTPHSPLDRSAIESVLGRQVSITIGFDGTKPEEATLAGALVLQRDSSSLIAKGAGDIARLIGASLKLKL